MLTTSIDLFWTLYTVSPHVTESCMVLQYVLCRQKHKKKLKPESFNFSAIHLIHDPQGMCKCYRHTALSECKIPMLLAM